MLDIKENVSLAILTSFRIGGPARYYAEVRTIEELKDAFGFAKEKNLDYYVLAGGTNLLVSDKGFEGLIIRMKISEINVVGDLIQASAGVPLIKVVNFSAENGFSGIESLAGVPGTLGGAVRGNAGAYGTEIGPHVHEVVALDSETLETKTFSADECDFGYRSSVFKKNKNFIVISATLKLCAADKEECKVKVEEIVMGRGRKGLQGVRSAGSYFMNPKLENEELLQEFEKDKGTAARNNVVPAGWVIERAGLRGKKIGGAQVSEEHANYIVNTGEASADNVMMLVSYVKQQVRDQMEIQLVEEVNYLGF